MRSAYDPLKAIHRTCRWSTCYRVDSLHISLQTSIANLLRCILLSRASNRCEATLKKHRSNIGPRCVVWRVLEFPRVSAVSPCPNCKHCHESIRTAFERCAVNACGYLIGLVYGGIEPWHNADLVVKVKNCHVFILLKCGVL